MRYANSDYKISHFTISLGFYFSVVILGVVDFFSMGSLLKYIAFFPMLLSFKKFSHMGLGDEWKPVLFYYIFAIASYFWSVSYEMSADLAFAYFTFLVLMFSISTQRYNEREIQFLKKCLHWSSRFSLIATWLLGTYSAGRLIIRSSIMAEDPNYLCAYFYFGIASCVESYLITKKKKQKIINIIEILLYLFTIFSTGSRGGLFGGIIVAGLLFFRRENMGSKSLLLSRFFLVGTLLTLVPLVAGYVNTDVMDRFTSEGVVESEGSGRYEIWNDAINAFSSYDGQSMLIGKGMGASREVAKLYHFYRVNVMHNVFLENLIGIGIIGVILYLWSIFTFYKNSKHDTYALSVFIGMLILSLSTSILYLKPYWNSMLYIVCLSMCMKNAKR